VKRLFKAGVTTLCVTALVAVALLIFLPAMLGWQRYVIVGGSMTGTIDKGSVVYARPVPTADLRVGDIITYVPPGYAAPVTHRIIAITKGQDGRSVFRTMGDFNPVADPWRVNLLQPREARYVLHVPYVGYAFAALAVRQVRLLLIALPAALIAFSLLWSLWRQAGEEVRRQEIEGGAGGAGGEA
jgi:signal peptidase